VHEKYMVKPDATWFCNNVREKGIDKPVCIMILTVAITDNK